MRRPEAVRATAGATGDCHRVPTDAPPERGSPAPPRERRGNGGSDPLRPEIGSALPQHWPRQSCAEGLVEWISRGLPRVHSIVEECARVQKPTGRCEQRPVGLEPFSGTISLRDSATAPFRPQRSARPLRPWQTSHSDQWTGTSGRHQQCLEAERSSVFWRRRLPSA